MKILLISNHNKNFINSNVYREKAIKDLGHKCVFFEEQNYIIPGRIRQKIPVLQKWDNEQLNQKLTLFAIKNNPSLCLIVGGYEESVQALRKIKEKGIKIALWITDPPTRFFENIIQTVREYDYVFCSGTEAIELLSSYVKGELTWVPFACDPDYHKPVKLSDAERKNYARDIVFVGSYYPNREEALEVLSEKKIGIWGPGWEKLKPRSKLKSKVINKKVNYTEWTKIYSAAKIVIVIHFNDGKTLCHQASPKLYEAMACKSFCLVDDQKDMATIFENGRHLVVFNGKEDLLKKVNLYLEQSDERRNIAQAGFEEVLKNHTYKHRLTTILNIIEQKGS